MRLFLTDFLITCSLIHLRVFAFRYKRNTKAWMCKISKVVSSDANSLIDFLITTKFLQVRVFGFGYVANIKAQSCSKILELMMNIF